MSGNKDGARKRIKTIRTKYGDDFFARSGAKGGRTWKGRTHTEESKRKMSEAKQNRHLVKKIERDYLKDKVDAEQIEST